MLIPPLAFHSVWKSEQFSACIFTTTYLELTVSASLFAIASVVPHSPASSTDVYKRQVLSIPCILGFSVWSGFQPLGAGTNIMDLEDFIVSNNILPLGSVVYLLFCTHKNGWGWKNFIQEANSGDGLKFPAKVRFYMTHILPWVVVVIYLKGYYDMRCV